MTLRLFTIGTLLAAALATAAPAFAQLPPRRPARPTQSLFGSGLKDTSQRLIISASFGTGFDDDLTKFPAGTPPGLRSGQFGTGNASLSYGVDLDAFRANFNLGTRARYYKGTPQPFLNTYSGGGRLSASLGSKASVGMSVRVGTYLRNMAIFSGDAYGN